MREVPYIGSTQKQIDFLRILGATTEELEEAENSAREAVSQRIQTKINDIIRPFQIGSVLTDKDGRQGVITNIRDEGKSPTRPELTDRRVAIKWSDTQRVEPDVLLLNGYLNRGFRTTGDVNESLAQKKTLEIRIQKRVSLLKRDLGWVSDRVTPQRVAGIVDYAKLKLGREVEELSDEELDQVIVDIKRNPQWRKKLSQRE